jgi:integrase
MNLRSRGRYCSRVAYDAANCAVSAGKQSISLPARRPSTTLLVVVDGKMQASTPKTSSSRRSLPLDASLVSLLNRHRKCQLGDGLRAGNAWTETGYVFADQLGRPYSPEVVSDRFDRLVKTSALPRIRLHDTRHTAASLMLASGVSVKVVQEMLGHSSPAITLAIYAHTTPSMAREAGAALSATLLE